MRRTIDSDCMKHSAGWIGSKGYGSNTEYYSVISLPQARYNSYGRGL